MKYSQSDWNKMKQDLELDFQAKLLNKEREWSKKLADKEKNISHLRDDNKMLQQSNEDMKYVFLAQISRGNFRLKFQVFHQTNKLKYL